MQKRVYVESVGSEITIARRKGTRSIRLSIRNDGEIRLSVPYGVSERYASKFLESRSDWIKKHLKPKTFLYSGLHIGKSHRLLFVPTDEEKIRTRIKQNEILIYIPHEVDVNSDEVQRKTISTCEKALKKEASNLLTQRIEFLSQKHKINYKSVSAKKLKSRWGSCDSRKNIVLNIYLMQLDWKLIDYVILHELSHTIHPNHQTEFWDQLQQLLPNYKELRKELKAHPTNVFGTNF